MIRIQLIFSFNANYSLYATKLECLLFDIIYFNYNMIQLKSQIIASIDLSSINENVEILLDCKALFLLGLLVFYQLNQDRFANTRL